MSKYEITVNGTVFIVEIGEISTSPLQVIVNGEPKTVEFKNAESPIVKPAAAPPAPQPPAAVAPPAPQPQPAAVPKVSGNGTGQKIVAPMPGKILSIKVKAGDKITEGDTICTLEAMKMEMPISTTFTGIVQSVHVNVGDNVAYNDPLVTVA